MKKIFLLLLIILSANAFSVPVVSFLAEEKYASEVDGIVTVTALLDSSASGVVTVPFIVSGTANPNNDHDLKNEAFIFSPGTRSSTLSFRVFKDTRNEARETIILTFQAAVNANLGSRKVSKIFLLNEDGYSLPKISFSSSAQSLEEGEVAEIEVFLSEPSSQIISVAYSVSGSSTENDHNIVDGVMTFFPGETTLILNVSIFNDEISEGVETLELKLLSPIINARPGEFSQHVVSISDPVAENQEIPASFYGEWKRSNIGTGVCEENYEADDDALNDESQNALAVFTSDSLVYFWRKYMDNTSCLGGNYVEDGFVSTVKIMTKSETSFDAEITISDLYRVAQGNSSDDLNNYSSGAGACAKNNWAAALPYYSADMDWLPSCGATGEGINSFTFSDVSIGLTIRLRGSITSGTTALIEESIDEGASWSTWMTLQK